MKRLHNKILLSAATLPPPSLRLPHHPQQATPPAAATASEKRLLPPSSRSPTPDLPTRMQRRRRITASRRAQAPRLHGMRPFPLSPIRPEFLALPPPCPVAIPSSHILQWFASLQLPRPRLEITADNKKRERKPLTLIEIVLIWYLQNRIHKSIAEQSIQSFSALL